MEDHCWPQYLTKRSNGTTMHKEEIKKLIVTFATLGALLLTGYLYDSQNMHMLEIRPNPYLVMSLILSFVYGLRFAVLFSLTSTVQYLILLHLATDYSAKESIFTFNDLLLPSMTIMLSIIAGEIRSRLSFRINELKEQSTRLENINRELQTKFTNTNQELSKVQRQLVTRNDTFLSATRTIDKFLTLDFNNLTQYYFELIHSYIKIKSSLLYTFKDESPHLFIEMGSNDEYEYKDDPLFQAALNNRRIITINEPNLQINALESTSMICKPIFDQDKIVSMLVIKEIDFLDFNYQNIDLINILSDFYLKAYNNQQKFNIINDNQILDYKYNIYSYEYFETKFYDDHQTVLEHNHGLKLLRINFMNLSEEIPQFDKAKKLIVKCIKKALRSSEMLFEGKKPNQIILILHYLNQEKIQEIELKIDQVLNRHREGDELKKLLEVDYKQINCLDYKDTKEIISLI